MNPIFFEFFKKHGMLPEKKDNGNVEASVDDSKAPNSEANMKDAK